MKIHATISAGSVEYSREDAEIDIDVLIADLQAAKDDGATHVLGLSGNYRGAQYVRLGTVSIDEHSEHSDLDGMVEDE